MAAQQIGGLETHDDRRELGEPRVEPQHAAAADDRGRDRQPDERRSDERQFLALPLTRAARRGAVGEDEPDRKSTRLNSSHYCASRMPSPLGKKNKNTQI